MIEAKFTHQQAAVIVAAVIRHQEGIPPLDTVLANILEQDIYNPIISQLDAGFEDAEAMRRVSEHVAAEAQYSASDLASAMSALTREEALEIAEQNRTKAVTFSDDLGQNLEPDSGSNPAESEGENDGQNDGQTDTSDAPNDREKEGTDSTPLVLTHEQGKRILSETIQGACEKYGVTRAAISRQIYGVAGTLSQMLAPSRTCSFKALSEAIHAVRIYVPREASSASEPDPTKSTGQRVLPAKPGEAPDTRTAIVMEPARMAQAILAIAQHEDDAKAADEVGFVLPSSRAIAVIRAECTEWVAEAKGILEAILPPSEQRDRRISLQEKIRIFAGQKGGERIVVLLDPVATPSAEEDGE